MMRRLAGLGVGLLVGCQAASQAFAWTYAFAPALGAAWRPGPELALYPPWALFVWRLRFPG